MLVKIATKKSIVDTVAALHAAVAENQFGVMHVHNLQQTMLKKGVEFAHECLVFEVCNPQQAKKVLEADMSVSTALPCRISVYSEGGQTMLATLRPTKLLALFDRPELAPIAEEVETTMLKIMQEAADVRA